MKSHRATIPLLIIIIFIIVLSSSPKEETVVENEGALEPTATINKSVIRIEIATSTIDKTRGLSGRKSLPKDSGMLFVYDTPGRYGFWMKDMNIALDIIWIDKNMTIVDITKNAEPESFPQSFKPKSPVIYVLEVNAGFSDKNNIKIGDKVTIEY